MYTEATSHLSEEKSNARKLFLWQMDKAKKAKEGWVKDTPLVICKYLREVHNIRVPDDFAEQITSAHNQFYLAEKNIQFPFRTVDAIFSSCDMWRKYIDDSEGIFDQLVCQEILSMARIRASVIAGRNFSEKQCLPLKEQPPYLFTTIVTESGALKVYS